jgi:hypothetical protein
MATRKPKVVKAPRFEPVSSQDGKPVTPPENQIAFMAWMGSLTPEQRAAVTTGLNMLTDGAQTPAGAYRNMGYKSFFRFWRLVRGNLNINVAF